MKARLSMSASPERHKMKKLHSVLLLLAALTGNAWAECYPSLLYPSSYTMPCVSINGYIDPTGHSIAASASSPSPSGIVSSVSQVDQGNSTSALLGGNATFTGPWVSTLNFTQVEISVLADQAATSLQVQFSNNGTTVAHSHSYAVVANIGKTIQVQPHGLYYRVVYNNGAVAQGSFNLLAVLKPIPSPGTIIEVNDVPTNSDDAALSKSIITGSAVDGSGFKNVGTTSDGALVVGQNTRIDAGNSTTVNLAAGASFTGAWTSSTGNTAIQYILNADQNMAVFVDQSIDGITVDDTDSYEYFTSLGGDGNDIQLIGSFYRIRLQNVGTATTTRIRFQVGRIPFQPVLPRTLTPEGNLKVGIKSIQDDNGFAPYFTPFGEQVSVPLYKLVGSVFNGSTLDSNIWTASTGTGGAVTQTSGVVSISTGTTANNAASLQTALNARFVAGQPNKFRTIVQLPDTGTANNARKWGAFTSTDGAYFQVSGAGATTSLSLCTMKASTPSCVASGSFNGYEGSVFTMDTTEHVYEIQPTPQAVYFFIDGELIHTAPSATTFYSTSWTSTLDLPVQFSNTNSGGSTTNVTMNAMEGVAMRLGIADAQPQTFYQAGTTAGVQVKLGAGNVRKAVVSNVSNTATITLYDGTSTGGRVIWSSGSMGAQTQPFSLDFDKGPFTTGLFLVISGAAANVYVTFD
jgi:hypothetical protein